MAAHKFLKIGTTGFEEEEAGVVTSAGAGDDGKLVALDAAGKIDQTMMPTGVGPDALTMTAGEALSAGDLVYISAANTVMKADANAVGKAAIGFVLSAISNAATGTVYLEGNITGLSSLTAGAAYFLSATTPGAVATAIPSGAADIVQFVGRAINTTTISFEPGQPIVRV